MTLPDADLLAARGLRLPPDPLGANYDPEVYWAVAGDIYEETFDPEPYKAQEAVIARALADLDWTTVLDAGCGFGRIGLLLQGIRPHGTYTGFDVSVAQIAACARRLPAARLSVDTLAGFVSADTYDLVTSVEVLMHNPASAIEEIVERLFKWSHGYVLTCDWYEPGQEHTANQWNVHHDYPALYGDRLIAQSQVGRQRVFVGKAG